MGAPAAIHSLTVVLCTSCTLRCRYCYQRAGTSSLRMSWPVLRASLDLALASPRRPLTIEFSGGEPLLALPMMKRALRYVGQSGRGAGVRYVLTTNGTLLGPDMLALLEKHDFEVRLSFHALPNAADRSGRAVLDRLDRVLDLMRTGHAALWRYRLRVAITVGIRELPALADSVEYLVAQRVREIGMSAALGDDGWRTADLAKIRRQFSRITRQMQRERATTGRLPVALYRKSHGEAAASSEQARVCSGGMGQGIAVEPGGEAYACAMLAGAASTLALGARSPLHVFRLGDVRASDIARRVNKCAQTINDSAIFEERRKQYSAYARCGECRFISQCSICPVSSAFGPTTSDPHRVSDFVCAFNRVMFAERERFPAEPSPWDRLAGRAPVPALVRQLHQHAARTNRAKHAAVST